MTFTVKTTKLNLLGAPPSVTPANYFVPGIGLPAKSIADYYNLGGLYGYGPCLDLDKCGAPGAAVKAAHGGMRYPWLFSSNHPNFSYQWVDGDHFMLGFTNDPGTLPTSLKPVMPHGAIFNTPNHPAGAFQLYEEPYVIYNPDDTTGRPFYCYAEVGYEHWCALFTSADFDNWISVEISHDHDPAISDWSSFQHIYSQPPGGAWKSFGLFESPTYTNARIGIWTSSTGITWTPPTVPIYGTQYTAHPDGRDLGPGSIFTYGGTTYCIARENGDTVAGDGWRYITIVAVDPVTLDFPYPLVSPQRIMTYPGDFVTGGPYVESGPLFLNDVRVFYEDGIAHIHASHGFASEVNTNAGLNGPHGAPYAPNKGGGGLVEEFIDYFAVIIDPAAAAQAAPCGVEASCRDGVVWLKWDDTLPSNTYRLYRGDATAQTTFIKDVAGTFCPDNPPLNQTWYYKLVTLDGGVERKSRVVHTYVSTASNLINQHRLRVLEDGGA